ncbi:MAG: DsbA family oxidoreductase [Microbacteriaceae bacterium]
MQVSSGMSEPIRVDIWSDIACPWCYIGKRSFEQGAAAFAAESGVPVEIEFHSFELAPENAVDILETTAEYLASRKGIQPTVVERMLAQVSDRAAEFGLQYDFAAVRNTNTHAAHELLHFAKAHGLQTQMKERLMSAYFVEGRHVGHLDELVALASEVGLDREQTRAALESGAFAEAVEADKALAASYGINGVPFFVIDGRFGLSGAQAPETFAEALREAATTVSANTSGAK